MFAYTRLLLCAGRNALVSHNEAIARGCVCWGGWDQLGMCDCVFLVVICDLFLALCVCNAFRMLAV